MPEPTEVAIRYHRSGNALWAVETGLAFVIPALLLFTGFSSHMRAFAQRHGRRWLPSLVQYALLFTLVMALLTFPLAYYAGYVRQHQYGLSNQSLGRWAGEWLKGVAVSGVGLSLVLWIPYLLLRRSPGRWWLYAGLASLPITTLLLVIAPVWVDPIFNQFGPLQDRKLESRILALAERAGIDDSRVYQVNKSADTRTVNAYVTGVGGTKRIVLWDTLLRKLEPDQILVVTAHEIGHFVLRHTLAVILGAALLTTVSLYLVHRVGNRLITRFSRYFRFDRLPDVASFPLLLMLGNLASLTLTPAVLAFSRYQETEADRFALELTRDNWAAATTFVKLQEENLLVPRPSRLYTVWRASHPSLADRVQFANHYCPWESGRQLRYQHLFRPAD
ncbi:MAG TPA: M48 family metallopeptidase [Gemmatimonadales bacterium]|nr:M48 family metallopeptidase [Gemmatimonadales bacterium]